MAAQNLSAIIERGCVHSLRDTKGSSISAQKRKRVDQARAPLSRRGECSSIKAAAPALDTAIHIEDRER